MNKFYALLASVALLGCAVVGQPIGSECDDDDCLDTMSQAAFFPEDDGEVAKVPENLRELFRDFCLASRDDIRSYTTTELSGQSQKVINVLMNRLGSVATEAMNSKLESLKEAAQNPGAMAERAAKMDANKDGKVSAEELEKQLVEDLEQAKSSGAPPAPGVIKRFAQGVISAIQYVARAIMSEAMSYLDEVKASIEAEDVVGAVQDACDEINFKLSKKIQGLFTNTRSSLSQAAKRSNNQELVELLQKTDMASVKCVTTDRLKMVTGVCDMVKSYAPIMKMVTTKMG